MRKPFASFCCSNIHLSNSIQFSLNRSNHFTVKPDLSMPTVIKLRKADYWIYLSAFFKLPAIVRLVIILSEKIISNMSEIVLVTQIDFGISRRTCCLHSFCLNLTRMSVSDKINIFFEDFFIRSR